MPAGRPKGKPKTGGRKQGARNKRTELLEAKAAEGIVPLDYMLDVMRDPKAGDERRDEMAKAAAPYVHARRAPEDAKGRAIPTVIYSTPNLEAEDE